MTKQSEMWKSQFGMDYVERNPMSTKIMDELYKNNYGISRSEMNKDFLDDLDRDIKILEVGSNIGLQLIFLQQMGFKNLYGIEINAHAVEKSKQLTQGVNIIQCNALDMPFKDGYFDMVFTSGVLIHINEKDLAQVMNEIYRCSKKWIWGFEYYSPKRVEINYRGNNDLLWKDNYPRIYMDSLSGLKINRIKLFDYIGTGYKDVMFLLEKK
jgi:pseudaminic acid biosynthesis-associated methylase